MIAPGLGYSRYHWVTLNLSKSNNWIILGNVFAELDFVKYFTFRIQFWRNHGLSILLLLSASF